MHPAFHHLQLRRGGGTPEYFLPGTVNASRAHARDEEVRASMLTAHYFRHNYAFLLYDADADILSAQRFLGHKDIKTTLAIYAHLSKRKVDRNADKVREMFRIKSNVAKTLPF